MTKRMLIVLLAGLNLVLLIGFLSRAFSPQPAWAQGVARGHEYALVAARIAQGNDALFMIDASARRLHVFRTNFPRVVGTPTRLALVDSRDLARDFGRREAR